MPTIQQPTLHARIIAFVVFVILLGIGLFLANVASHWLGELRHAPRPAVLDFMTTVIRTGAGLIAFIGVTLGAYLWWVGKRTKESKRYPPSGAVILRATVVIEGAAAVKVGARQQVIGSAICLFCLGFAFVFYQAYSHAIGRAA